MTLFTSHSVIPSFPPNVNKFPNFYNAKEIVYVLKPGDALYIPKDWFHWVFSYPDSNSENIAFSYRVNNTKDTSIYNEFSLKKPYTFYIKTKQMSIKDFDQSDETFNVFRSKSNVIVPVDKGDKNSKLSVDKMTITEMLNETRHNVYLAQTTIQNLQPPQFLSKGFSNATFTCFNWLAKFAKKNNFIDSGLHYDNYHGILIQVSGTKVVRLYKPSDAKNMYLSPMNSLVDYTNKKPGV